MLIGNFVLQRNKKNALLRKSELRLGHNTEADMSRYLTYREPRCRAAGPGQDQGQRHCWRSNTIHWSTSTSAMMRQVWAQSRKPSCWICVRVRADKVWDLAQMSLYGWQEGYCSKAPGKSSSQGKRGARSCFYHSSTEVLPVKELILVLNQTFLTKQAKLEGRYSHIVLGHSASSRLKCADVLKIVRQSLLSHGVETLHLGDKAGKGSEYFLHCIFKAVSVTIIWELKY